MTPDPRGMSSDPVNRPAHYTAGSIEVIQILEQAVASAPSSIAACLQWQTLKYLHRMWLKANPVQDAQKARWYLSRLIDALEPATEDSSVVAPPTPAEDGLALRVQRMEAMRETEKAALLDAFRQIDELKQRIDFHYSKIHHLEEAIADNAEQEA